MLPLRAQAEVLLSVGELAHDFDHVTAYLVRWIEHQQASEETCISNHILCKQGGGKMTPCRFKPTGDTACQLRRRWHFCMQHANGVFHCSHAVRDAPSAVVPSPCDRSDRLVNFPLNPPSCVLFVCVSCVVSTGIAVHISV